MSVTKKSILIAILFAVISSTIYFYSLTLKKEEVKDMSGLPTFIATDTNGTLFDKSGKVSRTMLASRTEFYEQRNLLIFDDPLITAYNHKESGNTNIWHLKGQKGRMVTNDHAVVNGNVVIYPGFKDAIINKATADNLVYNFTTEEVTSKDLVTIYGHVFKTEGTHFKFNLSNNVMNYKGKPHATFYPKSKKD
ncbi:LPS export ABC transporter periplasmic protein LptC [Succinivibrio dextrinosolvens]|uniref:LPS export ABC transporter periplasmic protein LptC n=1 Tax=Succinivibrio dextrinosolvens TaxID=83771 RepID=UPI00241C9F14|nr:LPS export ABC transporter periplasmic protein LptC [Succinivibrio dextrinosolvens]MBE6423551.1 LPS export ABC transporter periplasmic protein LptC [Succinivibrio dextrinosolvens]